MSSVLAVSKTLMLQCLDVAVEGVVRQREMRRNSVMVVKTQVCMISPRGVHYKPHILHFGHLISIPGLHLAGLQHFVLV
jgi:hypothetical protein